MRLIGYEIRKHLNRFQLIFVCVMLILCVLATFFVCGNASPDEAKQIIRAKEDLLELYRTDRNGYEEAYADYSRRQAEYEDVLRFSDLQPDAPIPVFENKFIDLPSCGDRQLFSDVKEATQLSDKYHSEINGILKEAYSKVRETGIQRGNFVYEYQIAVIRNYEKMSDLELPAVLSFGWEDYFMFRIPVILLLLTSVMMFSGMYLTDKRTGAIRIIRISKKGGISSALVKVISVLILSAVLVLLFTLLPLAVILLKSGLSDAGQYLQSLSAFRLCPFPLRIWQVLALLLLSRTVVLFVFGLFITLLSQTMKNEIAVYAAAVPVLILNYLLTFLPASSNLYFLKKYRIFGLLHGTDFFDRYHAVDLFGNCVNFPYLALIGVLTVGIVFITVSLRIGLGRNMEYKSFSLRFPVFKRLNNGKGAPSSSFSDSILYYEFQKLISKRLYIFLFLIAVLLKIVVSVGQFAPLNTHSEQVYQSYLADLSGPVTEEKTGYIRAEREYIDRSTADYEKAKEEYQRGNMDYETFHEAQRKYNYSYSVTYSFERIEERLDYLNSVHDENPDAQNIEFVYDAGIVKYLTPEMDFVLVLLLVTLLCDLFSHEYDSSFAFILQVSRNGREKTFSAKLRLTLIIAAAGYLLFSGIDSVLLLRNYGFDNLSAGIMSIPEFSSVGWNLSILQYAMLYKLLGFFGALTLSVMIVSVSAITGKLPVSIAVITGVVMIPYLLSAFGIGFAEYFSIAAFLSPEQIVRSIPTAVILTFSALILALIAKKKWIQSDSRR